MGRTIGYYAVPNAMRAIIKLWFRPDSFCSGLRLRLLLLLSMFLVGALFLALYHYQSRVLYLVVGPSVGTQAQHVLTLAAIPVNFLSLAWRGFASEDVNVNG